MRSTVENILNEKIIMIVRGVPESKITDLAEAMWRGGIRIMECTYDASGKIPASETARVINTLSERFEGRMLIGAGTVLSREQVLLTKEAGGQFIISPDVNEDVIKETKKAGLVSIPGALTPSEATLATRAGADFVKLFPISQLGASYVKALCAPLSHIRFLAVGGVNLGNIRELLKSGACGVGIGLGDADRDAIARGDLDFIEKKCASFTEALGK